MKGPGLVVSPRRWKRDGFLRRTLGNWALTVAYAVGISPARLARYYTAEGAPEPS